MFKAFKKLLFCLFFTISFSLLAVPVAAQQEFNTRFTSSYTVSSEGVTTVIHQIELTNKLANVYASQYDLTIGSTQVKNIQAESSGGQVTTTVTTGDNNTQIKLEFIEPIVGKNKTLRFTVSYINLDIATRSGRVLEVNIPRIANVEEIDDYNLIVKVPDTFDTPTIMSPVTSDIIKTNGQQILRYTKKQITSRGISILFGDHQVYDFTLRYNLKNPGITSAQTQIAIPPDTPYQKLFYHNIAPLPQNITVDVDGNWLAHYRLKPQQTLEIIASGQALLYLKPIVPIPSLNTPENYLSAQKYWPVTDPNIINLAQKLKTPENIYNYLVANLTYNYQRIDASTIRLGADNALKNPHNAICTEFTDLFVALARAAGIPARSQDGFAFTANSKLRPLSLKLDVLHAWPEYYHSDKQQWVSVDPTWGHTTQGIDYFSRWDLNHFTFAIHGLDSSSPYPAGAYKLAQTQGKDVNVAFSLNEPIEKTALQVHFSKPKLNLPLASQEIHLKISNQGNTALTNIPLQVSAPGYAILSPLPDKLAILPPQASLTLPLKLKKQALFQSSQISVNINQQQFNYSFSPAQIKPAPIISLVIISLLFILIIRFSFQFLRKSFYR